MRMLSVLVALLLACGGSKPSAPAEPVTEPPPPVAVEPAPPAEPVEPAKPAELPPPDPAKIKMDLLAAETAAFENAKPVFEKWCAKCHSRDGKMTSAKKREHFDMTKYPFGGHHAMELSGKIREVLGVTGKKPTMPFDKKGAVKGTELELIKTWADAFDASHAGGAHEGHDTGHKH